MGIVESETGLFAQLKGSKTVEGTRGSKIETGEDSELITVGNKGSVCVDMDAEEGGGMIGGFVWMETEEVVVGSVWVVTLTFEV